MKRFVAFSFILFFSGLSLCYADFDGSPFYANVSRTNGACFFAIRPFYSYEQQGERWCKNYLWPLYTKKGVKDEVYSRLLFFGYTNDFSDDDNRHRTWLLPFWFSGEDKHGESYWAIWPLGGSIHEFLGRDKISFALWPLYAKSHVNDQETTSVFWPIYSKTVGDDIFRQRVWPFYGTSMREDVIQKKFIAWPFYNSVEFLGDKRGGGGFMLFPLYGHFETDDMDVRWYLPPLFRFSSTDKQKIVHAPWPFVQWADGVMHKRYIWPLYGVKEIGQHRKNFLLWPFIWNNRTTSTDEIQYRKYILPLFGSEKIVSTKEREGRTVGEVTSRYWKLWPLMSWDRENDKSRFRLLELWPMRNTSGVEKNWASFWTLYNRTREKDTIGHNLLWGLYRQSRNDEMVEWSLLKGLAGYKKTGGSRTFTFLFMNFGGDEEE